MSHHTDVIDDPDYDNNLFSDKTYQDLSDVLSDYKIVEDHNSLKPHYYYFLYDISYKRLYSKKMYKIEYVDTKTDNGDETLVFKDSVASITIKVKNLNTSNKLMYDKPMIFRPIKGEKSTVIQSVKETVKRGLGYLPSWSSSKIVPDNENFTPVYPKQTGISSDPKGGRRTKKAKKSKKARKAKKARKSKKRL
jgi:hypothetical protein